LAYLRKVDNNLKALELSPRYRELSTIYTELKNFIQTTDQLKEQDKRLLGFAEESYEPVFHSNVSQEDIEYLLEDMRSIFLPATELKHANFTQLKEFVYHSTKVEPIGIEQLYNKEGYAMVKYESDKLTQVYRYKISSYANTSSRIKVYLHYLDSFEYSLSQSFEGMKAKLNEKETFGSLNTYLVQCALEVPYDSTLLPIVKGSLYKYISTR
jgi:hypothetical protein